MAMFVTFSTKRVVFTITEESFARSMSYIGRHTHRPPLPPSYFLPMKKKNMNERSFVIVAFIVVVGIVNSGSNIVGSHH